MRGRTPCLPSATPCGTESVVAIQEPHRGVVRVRGQARPARGLRCRMAGAGCTAGPAPAHGRRRGCSASCRPRTVHGRYGAEMRELRRLMRLLDEEQRRVLELVK